jgi:hypothetical protein
VLCGVATFARSLSQQPAAGADVPTHCAHAAGVVADGDDRRPCSSPATRPLPQRAKGPLRALPASAERGLALQSAAPLLVKLTVHSGNPLCSSA